MTGMSDDIERILERVLCGELTVDDPEVQELATRHPGVLAELKQLQSIQGVVGGLAADAAEVAAQARGSVTGEDRRIVRRIVEPPKRGWWSPVVAIAAVALLALAFWAWPRDAEPPTGMLSAEGLAHVAVVDDVVQVVFEAERPRGGRYHLRLVGVLGPSGAPLEADTQDDTWQFPPEWTDAARGARAPQLIVWVTDLGGETLATHTFELSQLSR